MENSSFQLIIDEANVETRNRRTFANKYKTFSSCILLLIIIFTIGYGYAFFKKITENITGMNEQIRNLALRTKATEAANKVLNETLTENLVKEDEVRQKLDQHDNAFLQLSKNFSRANQKIIDIIERLNSSLEEKMLALGNVPAEMEKVRQEVNKNNNRTLQLQENISDTNEKISDVLRSIDKEEAVNKEQNSKLTGFMNMPTEIEKLRQRLDKYENLPSQISKNISDTDKQAYLNITKRIDALEASKKCRWVKSYGGNIPPGAAVAGNDRNGSLYVARMHYEGALIPGKFVPSLAKVYVTWKQKIVSNEQGLVLCNCTSRWLPMNYGTEIPANAFIAGATKDGESLYVGRAEHNGSLTLGKVELHDNNYIPVCFISFDGKEVEKYKFEILVL